MAGILYPFRTVARHAVPLLVVVLLLAATAASGQSPGDRMLSLAYARGRTWCSGARIANAEDLATLSKDVDAYVGAAERAEQLARERVSFYQEELRNAENTRKQKAFELDRLAAASGPRWSANPAVLAAEQSRARADEALAFRRGLIARTTRLRDELAGVKANPDPTSTRSIEDVTRELEMAERVLRTAREKVSDQELDDTLRSALAAVKEAWTSQDEPALLSAAEAWLVAVKAIAPAEEALRNAEMAVSVPSELARIARADREEAAGCIAVRRAQLSSPDASAPATPASPGWAGQVSGVWSSTCGEASDGGRFSLTVDAQGNFTVTFVEGAAASIAGSVDSAGKLSGGGSYEMGGRPYRIRIWGTVSRSPSGGLSGTGNFASGDGRVVCNGSWGK